MYATSAEIKCTLIVICCVHSYTRCVLHACLQNSRDKAPGEAEQGYGSLKSELRLRAFPLPSRSMRAIGDM